MICCKRPGCGAALMWRTTPSGKQMPLDVEMTSRGNVVLEDGVAVVLKADDPRLTDELIPKWTPHFITCRNPPERKKK